MRIDGVDWEFGKQPSSPKNGSSRSSGRDGFEPWSFASKGCVRVHKVGNVAMILYLVSSKCTRDACHSHPFILENDFLKIWWHLKSK